MYKQITFAKDRSRKFAYENYRLEKETAKRSLFSGATVKTGRKKPQRNICFIMKMETR